MSTHTPEPWQVGGEVSGCRAGATVWLEYDEDEGTGHERDIVWVSHGGRLVAIVPRGEGDATADARLIAASPTMVAALEAADAVMDAAALRGIQDWLGEGPSMVWAEAHRQVRAALEKARGTNG